jgi:hypothetical protein
MSATSHFTSQSQTALALNRFAIGALVAGVALSRDFFGVVAGTPAGLLDTQLANDLDINDAAQIQRFSPPQV